MRWPTFRPFRRSRITTREPVLTYVRTPRTSLDRGAEWATPTALEFEHEVMHRERVAWTLALFNELPIPPDALGFLLAGAWERAHAFLDVERLVIDAGEAPGFRFGSDPLRRTAMVVLEMEAWPAVDGVTVPHPDDGGTL